MLFLLLVTLLLHSSPPHSTPSSCHSGLSLNVTLHQRPFLIPIKNHHLCTFVSLSSLAPGLFHCGTVCAPHPGLPVPSPGLACNRHSAYPWKLQDRAGPAAHKALPFIQLFNTYCLPELNPTSVDTSSSQMGKKSPQMSQADSDVLLFPKYLCCLL